MHPAFRVRHPGFGRRPHRPDGSGHLPGGSTSDLRLVTSANIPARAGDTVRCGFRNVSAVPDEQPARALLSRRKRRLAVNVRLRVPTGTVESVPSNKQKALAKCHRTFNRQESFERLQSTIGEERAPQGLTTATASVIIPDHLDRM
jgi:hypothetical protein